MSVRHSPHTHMLPRPTAHTRPPSSTHMLFLFVLFWFGFFFSVFRVPTTTTPRSEHC